MCCTGCVLDLVSYKFGKVRRLDVALFSLDFISGERYFCQRLLSHRFIPMSLLRKISG